jgi:adenylate cyclase
MKSPWRKARTACLLALLPALLGLALIYWPPTASLEATGLDLLVLLRGSREPPPQVCVVAIDEDSFWVQNVDPTGTWPRALHGELVRTLAREGARAVAFDVLFEGAGDPEQDAAFEAGLREAGNVILGSTVEQTVDPRFREFRLIGPEERFTAAAAAVADVDLPEDRDGVIRRSWLMHDDRPSLALAAYEIGTGERFEAHHGQRLIDYYGPPRTIPTVSLYQALAPQEYLPPGFFQGKIVFVGASLVAAATPTEVKDSFRTPFHGGAVGNTFGVEIHATLAANLLEGRGITRMPALHEALLLVLLSLAATLVFVFLRPMMGAVALVVLVLLPWVAGYLAFVRLGLWEPVLIPSVIQMPTAYVTSVVWYYFTTVREREKIRKAFTFYLSPNMIRKVTESPDQLNLGGEELVATAMFTDIKGFTSIAEGKSAPETAALLNEYFSEATGHVFDTGGTLIKYIGDAIFAIWGAPVRMDDHATAACRAAVGMTKLQEALADSPAGQLSTRIGVHTGLMLVGNLGSSQRFDYTAIGDTVNLAARLEGVNKRFGTQAIISDETLRATDGSLAVRPLGKVQVVGRAEPVAIYELLGPEGESGDVPHAAQEHFRQALEDYGAARFKAAWEGFRKAQEECGGHDGPSAFYLELIEGLQKEVPPGDWNGVIRLDSK